MERSVMHVHKQCFLVVAGVMAALEWWGPRGEGGLAGGLDGLALSAFTEAVASVAQAGQHAYGDKGR